MNVGFDFYIPCSSECRVLYEHTNTGHTPAVLPPQGLRLVPGQQQRHQTGGHRASALRGQQRQPYAKQFRQKTNY